MKGKKTELLFLCDASKLRLLSFETCKGAGSREWRMTLANPTRYKDHEGIISQEMWQAPRLAIQSGL